MRGAAGRGCGCGRWTVDGGWMAAGRRSRRLNLVMCRSGGFGKDKVCMCKWLSRGNCSDNDGGRGQSASPPTRSIVMAEDSIAAGRTRVHAYNRIYAAINLSEPFLAPRPLRIGLLHVFTRGHTAFEALRDAPPPPKEGAAICALFSLSLRQVEEKHRLCSGGHALRRSALTCQQWVHL